jgi:hypothetical protein
MTPATEQALSGLRDLSTIKWYIIPLLAIISYIYTREIKEARQTKNWNAILAGLTVFGADFFNETWNGWVMYLTQRSAFWTAPRRHGSANAGGLEYRNHVHVSHSGYYLLPHLV